MALSDSRAFVTGSIGTFKARNLGFRGRAQSSKKDGIANIIISVSDEFIQCAHIQY